MNGQSKGNAFDHVVVVVFENRSLDGPGDGKTFAGVVGKDLPVDPEAEIPPEQALPVIHNFLAIQFPLLHRSLPVPPQPSLRARQP
jgi:hypothetical protein